MCLVCSKWKDIVHNLVFPKCIKLTIKPVNSVTHQLNSISEILKDQLDCDIMKVNVDITIHDPNITESLEFAEYMELCGPKLKSMHLRVCNLNPVLLDYFKHLKALEELKITTETFNPINYENLANLPNLRKVSLNMENYFMLKNIPNLCSSLNTLSLERFEVDLRSLKYILDHHQRTLKEITVKVDEMKQLLVLMNSFHDLKLTKLDVKSSGCEDDFTEEIIKMFKKQNSLAKFRCGSELPLRVVSEIFKNLLNLNELDILAETIPDSKALQNLTSLEKLSMSLYDVTPWDERAVIKSVKYLNLSVTFPMQSPAIFKSFPNLIKLQLEDVDEECMRDIIVVKTLMANVHRIVHLDLESFVFKEREILNEAVNPMNRLQYLKVLKFSCWDMSNASLLSFNLPELCELYLTRCPGVTIKGIKYLCEKCPLLNTLHFEYNKNGFDDDCIEMITRKLHLKTLEVTNMKALTNNSLEHVIRNCDRLKVSLI